jgi:hypothetical protein
MSCRQNSHFIIGQVTLEGISETRAMFTSDLIKKLTADDERPWATCEGKGLNAHQLARLLAPYQIESKQIRQGKDKKRGYERFLYEGTFQALSRYFEYIDALAEKAGASTPLFDLAANLYHSGIKNGFAEHDVAAIKEVIAGQPRSRSSVKRTP